MDQQSPLLEDPEAGETSAGKKIVIERKEFRTNYYQELAASKSIRPICIAEGVDLASMSSGQRACWWSKTFFQLTSLIVLSVRTDRLSDKQYLHHHSMHYLGMFLITFLGWTPQVMDTFGQAMWGESPIPRVSLGLAAWACFWAQLYYILGISLFFKWLGPILRRRLGKAKTVMIWEYYVSVAWQVQTLGFWLLTLTPPLYQQELLVIPPWLTTSLGVLLLAAGIGSKMGAIYGTGYNTYYWYDMVTEIPNAYFVQVGIYKHCGSPTYTLGRFMGFGAALHFRSVPVAVASLFDLLTINLFNQFVEQPFVKRMYIDRRPSV